MTVLDIYDGKVLCEWETVWGVKSTGIFPIATIRRDEDEEEPHLPS